MLAWWPLTWQAIEEPGIERGISSMDLVGAGTVGPALVAATGPRRFPPCRAWMLTAV
jgi:hypothetical protein